jgi:hypothetical protein
MQSPLFWKPFLISLAINLFLLLWLCVSFGTCEIKKSFIAYGCHSIKPTQAYFAHSNQRNSMRARSARFSQRKTSKKPKLPPQKAKKLAVKKQKQTTVESEEEVPVKKQKKLKKPKKIKEVKKVEPEETDEGENNEEGEESDDEVMHFELLGETDPKMILKEKSIQREISRVWRPPVGVMRGTVATGQFDVDSHGKIKEFKIIQKSPVVIYDLSIVRDAQHFKFEKCLWGTKFTVMFKQ